MELITLTGNPKSTQHIYPILIHEDWRERLYLVAETSGTLFADGLRSTEAAKIFCGEAHFSALAIGDNPARYVKATKR